MNPEPITVRWMRGISWRMVREIIFGIGSAPLTPSQQPLAKSALTPAYSLSACLRPTSRHPQSSPPLASHHAQGEARLKRLWVRRLNQMTDYWEERIPHTLAETETLRNALGSLMAGVCSGYLSHIPHNLSTLKLMMPSK